MGLMQQAYDTYDNAEKDFSGVYVAGAKEPLAPVGHTVTKAAIEITVDKDGRFVEANAVSSGDEKTIYPVTEESANRSGTFAFSKPHPLCDQLKYLYPQSKSYSFYLELLEKWESSDYAHPVLTAVLQYVKRGSIIADLCKASLVEVDAEGNIKKGNGFVRWIVNGVGDESGPCWKNRKLHESFAGWYIPQQIGKMGHCMISGETSIPARQHAKGVVALNGNAKLISANDSSGFTYRGRFLTDAEALCVGYNASQKAHNALRWVISNQGTYFGGRCFVCWSPCGKALPKPTGIMAPTNGKNEKAYTPTAYKELLRNALNGWKDNFSLDEKAVIAVFDAATTGRLSITYYSELQAEDFIERLGCWEEACCWPNGSFGIQSPSLSNIARYAFGTLRRSKHEFEVDADIEKQVMLQLLSSRVDKTAFPYPIEHALVQKAGNLQIASDDREHEYLRRKLLFTTCAVIRKYRYDRFREEWNMALEPDKKDRSYQFGRLMAILEKIEEDTYDSENKRETNMIRRQQAFVTKPFSVAESVLRRLKTAYYPQLSMSRRVFYEAKIESIMDILSEYQADLNKPLGDTYLLGYYLQKREMYAKKEQDERVEE